MRKATLLIAATAILSACNVSTDSAVHAYNGNTVEIQLYGDTFAYGSEAQQQAQINAAQVKAAEVCGGKATFLSRRMDAQPQNGIVYVPSKNIALFKCG
ncbi:hypothetical protein [Pseudogemmobacter blasticus]|uniref:hypothetical protein n=1 Tax=Fuscovulum blasticum TaxID=1075 RepID=UPI0011B20976|nr:hypothetical protein [Fuscovulum blasticum]